MIPNTLARAPLSMLPLGRAPATSRSDGGRHRGPDSIARPLRTPGRDGWVALAFGLTTLAIAAAAESDLGGLLQRWNAWSMATTGASLTGLLAIGGGLALLVLAGHAARLARGATATETVTTFDGETANGYLVGIRRLRPAHLLALAPAVVAILVSIGCAGSSSNAEPRTFAASLESPVDGVGGEGAATERLGDSHFNLTLHGLAEGRYVAVLRDGSCDAPGTQIEQLGPLFAGAGGDAGVSGPIPASIDSLEGWHLAVLDASDEPVACGSLIATPPD